MKGVYDLLKFLLGAGILILAAADVDPQPAIVVLALLLMGVITVDHLREFLNRRNGHNHTQKEP